MTVAWIDIMYSIRKQYTPLSNWGEKSNRKFLNRSHLSFSISLSLFFYMVSKQGSISYYRETEIRINKSLNRPEFLPVSKTCTPPVLNFFYSTMAHATPSSSQTFLYRKTTISRLDSTNYRVWSSKMTLIFKQLKSWAVVEGRETQPTTLDLN